MGHGLLSNFLHLIESKAMTPIELQECIKHSNKLIYRNCGHEVLNHSLSPKELHGFAKVALFDVVRTKLGRFDNSHILDRKTNLTNCMLVNTSQVGIEQIKFPYVQVLFSAIGYYLLFTVLILFFSISYHDQNNNIL
jgi:hypothetical protein